MKRFLPFAFLLCALSPTRAQTAAPVPAAIAPITTRDDLTITPLDVEETDVASMLEIKLWRFKIQTPASNLILNYRLELRRASGEAVEIIPTNAWMISSGEPTEMTLGMMPVGKEPFNRAESIKLYTRLESGSSQIVAQGRSVGYYPNPMRDLKIVGYSFVPYGYVDKDGSVSLVRFRASDTPGKKPIELVLVLTAKKPEPHKP